MIVNPETLEHKDRYKLLTGSVLPRPIAWVSTMSAGGHLNLAPFSYFNAVCATPMTVMFCPGVHPWGDKKDTWRNIEEVPEFVVNLTNEDTAQQMNLSATILPHTHSEFEWAGVTPASSESVSVPRVAEAPISFECTLREIVVISDQPGGAAAIFGAVQRIHVRDDIYRDGYVHLDVYKPIGRLVGAGYTRVVDTFEMKRVPPPAAE